MPYCQAPPPFPTCPPLCITPSHLQLLPVFTSSPDHQPELPALAPASSRHEDGSLLDQGFASNHYLGWSPVLGSSRPHFTGHLLSELQSTTTRLFLHAVRASLAKTEWPCLLRAILLDVHGNLRNHSFLTSSSIPSLQQG